MRNTAESSNFRTSVALPSAQEPHAPQTVWSGYTGLEGAKKFLDCSAATIYRRMASGELPAYKLGTRTIFKIEDLDALPKPLSPSGAGNDNDNPAAA